MVRRLASPLVSLLVAAVFVSGEVAAASEGFPSSPPRVVLVLDKSGSMEGERYERLSDAVTAALAILPDGAEVAIVVFDHEATLLSRTTKLNEKSRRELVKAVASVKPEGGTDIIAGTAEAVKLLSPKGGVVLLLSDGLQTGATGNTPWPRAKWEPLAKAVSEQARKSDVVSHTIALGPDAESDELLEFLARSTGGEHWKIRKPDELLARYVEIAAQLSSFWMRSDEGDFTLSSEEVVIQIIDKKAAPTLFKRQHGRLSPVAVEKFSGNRVRAERFVLPAGAYSFKPGKGGSSSLLRPMKVRWKLPLPGKLPAGREVKMTAQAVASPDAAAALKDLVLSARFGGEVSPLKITADTQGLFTLKFNTPKKLQPLSAVFEAAQGGWRYPVGRWSAELVTPPPVIVSLKPRMPLPLALATSGSGRAIEIEAEAETDTPGVPVELTVSTPTPGLEAHPSGIRIDISRKFTVTIKRTGTAAPPGSCEGTIKFAVTSEDLVPPKLNGAGALTWDFSWSHLNPRLEFRGLTQQDYSIRRGGSVVLPVEVKGVDLSGKTPSVLLEKADCPKGVRAGLAVREGRKILSVPSLPVGTNGAVEISVDSGTPPGAHRLTLWTRSDDSSIPLNGSTRLNRIQFSVVIPEIEVDLQLQEAGRPWVVVAPVKEVRREVVVEIVSRDGEALPDLKVVATSPAPVQVTRLGTTPLSPSRLQSRFELLIPAQSRPFQGEVRFAVQDARVGPSISAALGVVVPPIRVRAIPLTTEATHYPGWAESLLRRIRPSPECTLKVVFEGAGWERAGCTWALVDEGSGRSAVRTPGEDGLVRFESVVGNVKLESRYAHTVFLPAAHIPVKHEATVVPVPSWIWSVPAALLVAVYFILFPPLPVEVRSADGVIRKLGRLRLGSLAGLPALRLQLRRGWLGRKALRSKRDRSSDTVVVHSALVGEVLLLAGMSCTVRPGDTIEVGSPGATRELVVGPGGAKAETSPESGNFFGELSTEKEHATAPRPDEWLMG